MARYFYDGGDEANIRYGARFSLEYEQDHHPRPPPYGKLVKWWELATAFHDYVNQLVTLDQLISVA